MLLRKRKGVCGREAATATYSSSGNFIKLWLLECNIFFLLHGPWAAIIPHNGRGGWSWWKLNSNNLSRGLQLSFLHSDVWHNKDEHFIYLYFYIFYIFLHKSYDKILFPLPGIASQLCPLFQKCSWMYCTFLPIIMPLWHKHIPSANFYAGIEFYLSAHSLLCQDFKTKILLLSSYLNVIHSSLFSKSL